MTKCLVSDVPLANIPEKVAKNIEAVIVYN